MEYQCKDGKHIGVNNTTGKCPLCGEQIEMPAKSGFSKALYLGDPIIHTFDTMGGLGIMPMVSPQPIHDLTKQENAVVDCCAITIFDNIKKILQSKSIDGMIHEASVFTAISKLFTAAHNSYFENERLRAENAILKQCVEEAIKKPMGVEPHIYSDWKMKQNGNL